MSVFLGVDGGGSKTAFLLVDEGGTTLAEHVTDSSYYFDATIDLVERVLAEGIGAVLDRAQLASADITRAFFGLPGYGEASADVAFLDSVPRRILRHDRYSCDNDMVCGWAGSLAGEDGINVISGTGSMTYGRHAGRGARVGGWGELFGDEGSAYWIGVQALNAFTRMSDGRLGRGLLHEILSERLGLGADLDVVSLLISGEQGRRTQIADLARSVSQASVSGDSVARGILLHAADELATLVGATRERLGYVSDETVPVSFSGGVFASDLVGEQFAQSLALGQAAYELRQPRLRPVAGAALFAALEAGEPLSESALERLGAAAPVAA